MSRDEFMKKWYMIAPFSKMEIENYPDRKGYIIRVVWFVRGELLTFVRVMFEEDMENSLVANSFLKEITHRYFESLVEEPEEEQKHSITKILEEVMQEMCDNYCIYSHGPIPEGKDDNWLFDDPESPCLNCPLNNL